MMQNFKKTIQRFVRRDDGVTAIEFALLVVPFTFFLIGLIELSLMFAATSMLEYGTSKAAREIRTGDFQDMSTLSKAETAFQNIICDNIEHVMDCSKLQYEVVPADDFTSAGGMTLQFDSDNNFDSRGFSLAGPDEVVLVRTIYRYKLKSPFFAQIFSDGPNGETRLLVSSNVIQVEPFKFQNSTS